jgi:hypothetical protein
MWRPVATFELPKPRGSPECDLVCIRSPRRGLNFLIRQRYPRPSRSIVRLTSYIEGQGASGRARLNRTRDTQAASCLAGRWVVRMGHGRTGVCLTVKVSGATLNRKPGT